MGTALTATLTQRARDNGVTLNTIVQAVWGILLGRLTGRDDVVFGITVAGRPPELPASRRWWACSSTPCRCDCDCRRQSRCWRYSTDLQESQSRLIAHQHVGLAEIQGLAGLGDLFDTLVVFENYPVDRCSLSATQPACR